MLDATFPGLCWEGFQLSSCTELPDSHCLVRLQPDPSRLPRCQHCGAPCRQVHDTSLRRVRDRDLFEYRVWLEVPVRRVRCSRCGVATERLTWLTPRARITCRFQQHVEVLLTLLPIKHVAQLTGLHWHTLKTLDKARLARDLPMPDLSQVRFLAMDEFALYKGHRYASVVMDAERTQVLWVGEGRSREAIRPFFEWLGEHCQHIEAVAMDMNSAMDLEVKGVKIVGVPSWRAELARSVTLDGFNHRKTPWRRLFVSGLMAGAGGMPFALPGILDPMLFLLPGFRASNTRSGAGSGRWRLRW